MTSRALLIASVMAALAAPSLRAADLLDQQLGPTAPAPAGGTTPAPQATPGPAARPGEAIIIPDAVRKVDDADLVNKLTQPDEAKPSGDNVQEKLHDMITRMDQSEKRLVQRDPGEVTQETQRRILSDLDVLIEVARKQCNKTGDPNAEQQKSQERQYSQAKGSGQSQGGSTAAQNSFLPRGGSATPTASDIRAKGPDEWGRLPAKDRDLVSHGANEEYLSSYRDMIDRYYQALAELGKSRSR